MMRMRPVIETIKLGASMKYAHVFTVEGAGTFPMDMLRYDRCAPMSQDDYETMVGRDRRKVTLIRYSETQRWQPTTERWRSFLWSVVTEESGGPG